MKASVKIAVTIAVLCILIGLFISFFALLSFGFDFMELDAMNTVTNTYAIEDPFTDIQIKSTESDIRFALSEDETCSVVCVETDRITHTVAVSGGTLTVESVDHRAWYDRVFNFGTDMKLLVYLPQRDYGALTIDSTSGDVEVPIDFSFTEADVRNTSGNVVFGATVAKELLVKTVSGDLSISETLPNRLDVQSTSGDVVITSVEVGTELTAQTVSGNLTLSDITCAGVSASSTSGEITCTDLISTRQMHLDSVSGNIELRQCDADALWLKTTSGNVSGTLLTEKTFVTETTSGHIDVPNFSGGGDCEIKTTSGNIAISIVE